MRYDILEDCCYKVGGCGAFEFLDCEECPASKPEYTSRHAREVTIEDGRIEGYLTIEEVAKKFNIRPQTIRQMINRGQIDTLRVGSGKGCLHFIHKDQVIPNRSHGRPRKGE